MSFVSSMSDWLREKSTARRGAAQRRRTLRLESLEERALLTAVAVEAASFSQLKGYAESGGDYEITLTVDITVGAGETIDIGGSGAGNISIDGGAGGHRITSSTGSRTVSLFNVSAGDSLTLNNLTISGFSYTSGNGAVFSQDGGSIAVNSGTTIASCNAVNGGVAYISGGTFTVGSDAADDTEVNFTGNAAGAGGVIFASDTASITIDGGTFSDNSSTIDISGYGGGVIYANGVDTEIAISGGEFSNNNAVRGGVIFASTAKSIAISGSTTNITKNKSTKMGGVIFADSGVSTITVSDGTFSENAASNNGGVIYTNGEKTITISGGTFSKNTSNASGGVIFASGASTRVGISGGTFSENFASSGSNGGGVIFFNSSGTLEIVDGTFKSNHANSSGGVVYAKGVVDITIKNGTFGTPPDNGNYAGKNGGVIYFDNSGTLRIVDGYFLGNHATSGDGGLVYAKDASAGITISGGTFERNYSSLGNGGLIFAMGESSKITISGGTFLNNHTATANGGLVYAGDASAEVTISGAKFEGNYANTSGGLVYFNDSGTLRIVDGEFIRNSAVKSGGLVYANAAASITIKSGKFLRNFAKGSGSGDGGGLAYLKAGGTLEIVDGTFLGNYAVQDGGLVNANGAATVTISSGTFGAAQTSENHFTNYAMRGGVLYLQGSTAHINGGTFSWNKAVNSPLKPTKFGLGGVIYATNDAVNDTVVNIDGAVFENSLALYGGVIYTEVQTGSSSAAPVTVNLAAVTMNNNTATANGGAIANSGAVVTDTDATYGDITAVKTFAGNSAVNGGAVLNSGEFTLSNAQFSSNYSSGNGGAVDNLADGILTLTGAKFSGNSSLGSAAPVNQVDWTGSDLGTGDGGAIQNWGTAELIDAYFVGNTAHDGGAIANGAGAAMTLSQTAASGDGAPLGFSGNSAVYGGAIINVGTLTRAADQTAEIVFTGNSSYKNGGAICNSDNNGQAADGSLGLYKASFTENTAGTAEQTGSGGAILSKKEMTIVDSDFIGNSANKGGKGGAIDHTGGTMVLTTNDFAGNSASATGFGGAVNTWAGASIDDCRFTENSAKYGGAVSVLGNDQTAVITDALFEQNSAVSYGGAVYASGTVQIDGAMIKDNTASLGGGVLAITSNISDTSEPQLGRGKVIFTGQTTIFEGNTATKKARGQSVGSDICASSSNSAAGNGGVIEIATMPQFSTGTGYKLAIDRSILVLPSDMDVDGLSEIVNVYYSKDTVCGYTYGENTLTFTALASGSGINRWRIYWSDGTTTDYTEGTLPSGEVSDGAALKIEGFIGTKETTTATYYLIPSLSAGTGAASEALFDEALLDDAEVFEGLAPQQSALEEYCEECYL